MILKTATSDSSLPLLERNRRSKITREYVVDADKTQQTIIAVNNSNIIRHRLLRTGQEMKLGHPEGSP